MQDNKLAKSVGTVIAEKRKRLGMTQAELAEKIGVEQESLCRMEKGIISPKFSRLELLASVLECSVTDFFRKNFESTEENSKVILELLHDIPKSKQEELIHLVKSIVAFSKKR